MKSVELTNKEKVLLSILLKGYIDKVKNSDNFTATKYDLVSELIKLDKKLEFKNKENNE